jgi:hypothetical protein
MRTEYQAGRIRTAEDLQAVLAESPRPVLLVEGIRALPDADRPLVVRAGQFLARRLPGAAFRSGNAVGTDAAFSLGVTAVDPRRMEYVITHPGMGRNRRHPGGRSVALEQVPKVADGPVGDYTVRSDAGLKGLVEAYRSRGRSGPLGARAAYLLRDTLKVVGSEEADLAPATAGLFYVNESDPLTGGTGHTVRVCLERGVPVVFQAVWRCWVM